MKRALYDAHGVKHVKVDFQQSTVTVIGSKDIEEDHLLQAIENTHRYKAIVLRE